MHFNSWKHTEKPVADYRAPLQIVYTAIVGLVMLAACLEWFLWIAAFMYCLWKVFVKAEHWTVRVLSVIIGIAFMLLRYVFNSFLATDVWVTYLLL